MLKAVVVVALAGTAAAFVAPQVLLLKKICVPSVPSPGHELTETPLTSSDPVFVVPSMRCGSAHRIDCRKTGLNLTRPPSLEMLNAAGVCALGSVLWHCALLFSAET